MATNNMTHPATEVDPLSLEEKKQLVEERLAKRDGERQANVEKRREEKSEVSNSEESVIFFTENFTKEKNLLETELVQCESLEKAKLVDAFDSISGMHQRLSRYVTDSTIFLPSFDLSKAQESLSNLHSKIQKKRDELIPKKKFAFKSKKKGNVTEKVIPEQKQDIVADDIDLADCKVTNLKNQNYEMKNDINSKDIALAELENCRIKLFGAPSAIHVNKLKNCTILSGPVSGSIFIRECTNCVFVVACQQLRIHTTTDTKFYIHVTSKAIIEDTSSVSFAPYNWTYSDLDEHYKLSGLDKKRNNWADVDDFNWLAADKHSPNWCLIPEDDRVDQWE